VKLHQLSIFLENRPGQLRAPSEALAREGLDILAMSLADTAQFGILRIVVKEWERARQVLESVGAVVNVSEVVPGKAAIVFRFEDPDRASAALAARGLRVLDAGQLLERPEG